MNKRFLIVSITMLFALASICAYANVTFAGKDTTTKGDWSKKYGKNGVILFAAKDQTDMKDIAKFDDAKNNRWDWANPTDDARGLITLTDAKKRMGTCMYNNPTSVISIESKIDNYQVALFVIDWDSTARIQELTGFQGAKAPDKPDATVQNPEFNAGVYYKWLVTGKDPFKIQVVHKGGANWVMSGLFLDKVEGSAVQSFDKLTSTWGGIRAGN
ncbi:TPA: hypothetical protein ENS27_14050 [bacterium]|nr:hypothetical protein [bacterium]